MTNDNTSLADTIYALSSAPGKAGVSVIRVSGPKSWDTLKIFNKNVNVPKARHSFVMTLNNPDTSEPIDSAMIVAFQGPQSFTGEDVVEYHCHGSQAVLTEVFDVLSKIEGCRMADHGEYTRRAFENDKMDLTEAEAIVDLIDAETKAQKDQAMAQMGGALANLYNGWAEDLKKILAYVEAVIDFPDEEVPDDEIQKVLPKLKELETKISAHLNDNRQGERLRSGIKIAVIGAPNAGKSTLTNKLAQRDVAIVSDMAGTTRDVIEVHLNIAGYPVIVADTAGLRPELIGSEGHDAIEGEGMRRALEYAQNADIRLLMFDGTASEIHKDTLILVDDPDLMKTVDAKQPNIAPSSIPNPTYNAKPIINVSSSSSEDENSPPDLGSNFASIPSPADLSVVENIMIINKTDETYNADIFEPIIGQAIEISAKNEDGIDQLLVKIADILKQQFTVSRETVHLTRNRHRENITSMHQNIQNAFEISEPELLAQELRFALYAIGRITGKIDVEDLLDVIFKDFCIGK
ncbi:MAG: tRNA uridine-5-carboxymethylaminomethyl(34) synthesis GTPase MnmE [Pseudomonadota bacterium]